MSVLLEAANGWIDDMEAGTKATHHVEIPRQIVLDFDFYRLVFLNCDTVSLFDVVLAFQRLALGIGFRGFSPTSVEALSTVASNNTAISWEAFNECLEKESDEKSKDLVSLQTPTVLTLSDIERIFLTLNDSGTSVWADFISLIRGLVIVFASVSLILESLAQFKAAPCANCEPVHYPIFGTIETVTIAAFTLDYLVRIVLVGFCRAEILDYQNLIAVATGQKSVRSPKSWLGRVIAFATEFLSIVDLVSIIPFYTELALSVVGYNAGDFSELRIIRLIALLRILRIKRLREMERILSRSFAQSFAALSILVFVFGILILIFAVIGYFFEGGVWMAAGSLVNGIPVLTEGYYRPQAIDSSKLELTPFTSIPAAMWWALITATTVGYGDMYPTTPWGKTLGSVLAISGIVILAMPIAVIGSNFTNEFSKYFAIKNKLTLFKDEQIHAKLLATCVDKVSRKAEPYELSDEVAEKQRLI